MKTCGIIGGMSWESTAEYYKLINEGINKKLGGLHSGKIIVYSVDFEEIAFQQKSGDWSASAEILSNAAVSLQRAGADFVLISTNTMHKVADEVKKSLSIKFLDIRDVTVGAVKEKGLKKILLLGTKFTMEDDFYTGYLKKRGINVTVPEEKERNLIHRVIFDELCLGITREISKKEFLKIIASYDIDGVVLGCTEIGMLIKRNDLDIEVLDTTLLHCEKALEFMTEDGDK